MGVFGWGNNRAGVLNQMEVTYIANCQPGMTAIMKRLRNGVEVKNFCIKIGASFEVEHRERNMVDTGQKKL